MQGTTFECGALPSKRRDALHGRTSPCGRAWTRRGPVERVSLRGFLQRAAAARALAGRAAEAMAGDADRIADDIRIDQVGQMHPLAAVVSERQVEHLVEVAVI